MCESGPCLLFAVVGVMIEKFTPLWATSTTVTWGIYQDSFPRRSIDLVKVESLRMTLCDWVERNGRMFRGGESIPVSCSSEADPYDREPRSGGTIYRRSRVQSRRPSQIIRKRGHARYSSPRSPQEYHGALELKWATRRRRGTGRVGGSKRCSPLPFSPQSW